MTTHQSQDAAIAAALAESLTGDQIVVHDEKCASRESTDNVGAGRLCNCSPTTLTVGARA